MAAKEVQVALAVDHLVDRRLQECDGEKRRHRQLSEPPGFNEPIHACPPSIGGLASLSPHTDTPGRTSLAKRSMTRCISAISDVMMSNTMWLTPQSA